MTKKDWLLVLGTAAVLTVGYVIYANQSQKPAGSSGNQQTAVTAAAASQTAGFFIGSSYVMLVTYNDNGFSPANVSIPKGGAVIFRNYSSKKLRVASNPHPSHNGYPVKNGCVGSAFDSCSDIPPKVSWSFTFDSPGAWNYHNHLNPSQGGIVTVKE
ncbi:MAG: hypothetical protein Q8O66_01100 [bacterium]|nr:hypothetical protein [bacterium]